MSELTIVEQHFKDEADRNREASLEAHREIGRLTAKTNHTDKELEYFKSQYNTAFKDLLANRNKIYSLASEIADELGSHSTISEKIDAIAGDIETQIDTLNSKSWSII